MFELVAVLVMLLLLFVAHRQAARRMLLVRPDDATEGLLSAAEEARPALLASEVLAIVLMVVVVRRASVLEMPVRVGLAAVVLVAGLLIAAPSGQPRPGPTPAWIRWVARLASRLARKDPGERPQRPRPPGPLDERLLLDRMLRFRQREIADVMVPRREVVGVDVGSELPAVLEILELHRHSRYLVYEGDLDHVVGMLSAFDLLRLPPGERSFSSLVSQVLMVPEGKGCDDLLSEMLATRQEFAVVVDEFGGTAGLVTAEDLMEELVGEIWDEDEQAAVRLRRVGLNVYVAEATLPLAEIAEHLALKLPEGDYETLAGFLLEEFGRIPVRGDAVVWEHATFEILAADRRRIGSVKITIGEGGGRR